MKTAPAGSEEFARAAHPPPRRGGLISGSDPRVSRFASLPAPPVATTRGPAGAELRRLYGRRSKSPLTCAISERFPPRRFQRLRRVEQSAPDLRRIGRRGPTLTGMDGDVSTNDLVRRVVHAC